LYVGRFASRHRLVELQRLRVTDIVNVSDTPSQLTIDDGPFRSVTWFDIEDRIPIPTKIAIDALDQIHAALSANNGCVYVHCMAGWNRSPTVIWLYLLACGVDRELATTAICANAYDAVPGHALLVNSKLVESVMQHGRNNYVPHPRPSVLPPATAEQGDTRKSPVSREFES
jgi:protein tyrosine phosphatase